MRPRYLVASLFLVATVPAAVAGADELYVDPDVGNSTFSAVFDAALGERITATSSAVQCDIQFDPKTSTASGRCSVPLATVRVDNDDTKSEHFREWATNKKSDPKDCRLETTFQNVKLSHALIAEKPVKWSAQLPMTICGRSRSGGGFERIEGTAILFPPGTYGDNMALRLRAHIEHFHRDPYQIGPAFTEGWLARVQNLAKVVAEEGTIEINLFARVKTPH